MNKKLLLLLSLVPFLVLPSCKNEKQNGSKQDYVMVNDFESLDELSLMKFPFPKHADRGRFDLSNNHVTHGNKSLKYSNIYGSYIEMCHFFDHFSGGDIDIANVKSIELDIFNDSDFDSSCSFMIYSTDEMNVLLTDSFDLKKGENTHLSFPLSKIALEFNANEIRSTSLKIYTPNTDYERGIGYTFYLDNWYAKLGSEYTEQDNLNRGDIEKIKNAIDALPNPKSISLSNDKDLLNIARDIDKLSDLYRRVIPNIGKYREAVEEYRILYDMSEEIDYDRNDFLHTDKFFGYSQLVPFSDTRAEVIYSEDKYEGKVGLGSTKIIFAGSDDSNFQFVSNVKLSDFDFIHFTIYNATDNLVRVWFSYVNEIFVDIPSKTLVTPSFAASTLSGQYYWAIHHLRSQYDSTRLPAYGSVYFGPVYVTGRSQETLSTQMQYIFSKLPNVSEVNSEDAYTRFVPMIKTARQLYNAVLDKSVLTEEETQRFYDLEDLISNSGYSVGYNSYDGSLMRFSTYGENFTGYSGIQDPFFGYVSGADITNCPPHQDVPTLHEQAITFTDDMKFDINAGGYVIYIFNPTPHPFNLIVRTTDWDWEKYGHLFVYQTLENGWNKVEMKTDLLKASEDHKVAFFISDNGSDLDMTGVWKFTSLVAVPRSI